MSIQKFIPYVWQQAMDNIIMSKQTIASFVNRLSGGDISQWGDTLSLTGPEDLRVKGFDPDGDIHPEDVLSIEHGAYFNLFVNNADEAQRALESVERAVENPCERLAIDSEQYLLSKIRNFAGIHMKKSMPKNASECSELIMEVYSIMKRCIDRKDSFVVVVPQCLASLMIGSERFHVEWNEGRPMLNCVGIPVSASKDLLNEVIVLNVDSVWFAGKVAKLIPYRPEKGFCDGVKGLYLCGAKVEHPNHICVCELI